jgi:VIT1/CCC1 family predicted Fe2+/Mn2+ transporter
VALGTFVKLQLFADTKVKVDPNGSALPGLPALEKLVDGLAAFILVACAAGALLGIGQWVFGSRSSNYSQADSGKTKVAIAAGGAFLVGALGAIINFFLTAGGGVK